MCWASISEGASDYLESPNRYRNPWRSVLPQQKGPSQEEQLAKPQYFFSGDGKLAFLLTRPVKDVSSFTSAEQSIARMREILKDLQAQHPELEFGLTGLPVTTTRSGRRRARVSGKDKAIFAAKRPVIRLARPSTAVCS